MRDCPPLQEKFYLKPSVYLATNIERDYYNLYVSVTMPPRTALEKVKEELESVDGGVYYVAVNKPDGCPEPWEFQELIPFSFYVPGEMENSKVAVDVSLEDGGGAVVIIHHADADEEGPLV